MNNEEKILAILEPMQGDIAGLKQGQAEIRQDNRALNQRVTIVKSKVLNELGVIKDGILGWKERNEQIDEFVTTQKSHGNRIFALEQLVGK